MGVANREAVNEALRIIGLAGFSDTTITAPSASAGLVRLLSKSPAQPVDMNRLLYDLKRRGLIDVLKAGKQITYTLTPAGAYRLQALQLEGIRIPIPKAWDRKWRLVAFDVPISSSRQRQEFVAKLQSLDFFMLQKSLWVYPFPCFSQVEAIASYFNVQRYLSLMEINALDQVSARRLYQHFFKAAE